MAINKKIIIFSMMLALPFTLALFGEKTYAYGECDQYGLMATYDYLSGGCKCMSGYVMGKDFMGDTQCVSGSTVCHDKYGYHSSYDSLSSSCECDSGYAFGSSYGTKQCVSLDSLCSDQLGYNSRYNSLYDKCECRYGYVIDGGRCTDGDQVCHSKHGIYSSYNDTGNSCACDSGYTLDNSSQCVKKQNNTYFKLLDVDTDNKQAILKSEYDGTRYLVTYGSGCYSFTIARYKNQNLVVNLGTDFDLDTWDTIVLQDDNETCDITHRERTYDDTLEVEEEEDYSYYYDTPSAPANNAPTQASQPTPVASATKVSADENFEVSAQDIEPLKTAGVLTSAAAFRKCPSTRCTVIRYYAETSGISVTGKYKKGDWYQIEGTADAGSTGARAVGWIHQSLIEIATKTLTQAENTERIDVTTTGGPNATSSLALKERSESFVQSIWRKFLNWFRK